MTPYMVKKKVIRKNQNINCNFLVGISGLRLTMKRGDRLRCPSVKFLHFGWPYSWKHFRNPCWRAAEVLWFSVPTLCGARAPASKSIIRGIIQVGGSVGSTVVGALWFRVLGWPFFFFFTFFVTIRRVLLEPLFFFLLLFLTLYILLILLWYV